MSSPMLSLKVSPDRDYYITVQQTKLVYDQLLADKEQKLMAVLMQEKNQHDRKCEEMAKSSNNKAMEYGVWAQQQLNTIQQRHHAELNELKEDYQSKLNKMVQELEAAWLKKKQEQK